MRISNLIIVLISVIALFSNSFKEKKERFLSNRILYIYPIYFVLLCLGIFNSEDIPYSFKVLESSLPVLILPFFLGTAAPIQDEAKKRLLFVVVMSAFLAAGYCLIRNLIFIKMSNLEWRYLFQWEYAHEHLTSYIGFHPTYFATFILISIGIIFFSFSWDGGLRKFLNVLACIFFIFFLMLLGAKIGIVILVLIIIPLGALMVFKNYSRKFGFVLIAFVAGTGIGLYSTPVVYWRFKSMLDSIIWTLNGNGVKSYDYRLFHWMCAWEGIKLKPIAGYGTGDYLHQLNNCYESIGKQELLNYNSHNQFLDLWLALGIIGLVISILLYAIPVYESIRLRNLLFLTVSVVFFAVSLTESILWTQKGIALFSFFVALFFGQFNKPDRLKEA